MMGNIRELEAELDAEIAQRRIEFHVGMEKGRVVFEEVILRWHRELRTKLSTYIMNAHPLLLRPTSDLSLLSRKSRPSPACFGFLDRASSSILVLSTTSGSRRKPAAKQRVCRDVDPPRNLNTRWPERSGAGLQLPPTPDPTIFSGLTIWSNRSASM